MGVDLVFNRLKPSGVCGPFRNKDTAYQVISERIEKWAKDNSDIASLLEFFTSSGFLIGVIIGLM